MGKKIEFKKRQIVEDAWVEGKSIPPQDAIYKHVAFYLEAELHKKFKTKVSSEGTTMKDVITGLIKGYCSQK